MLAMLITIVAFFDKVIKFDWERVGCIDHQTTKWVSWHATLKPMGMKLVVLGRQDAEVVSMKSHGRPCKLGSSSQTSGVAPLLCPIGHG